MIYIAMWARIRIPCSGFNKKTGVANTYGLEINTPTSADMTPSQINIFLDVVGIKNIQWYIWRSMGHDANSKQKQKHLIYLNLSFKLTDERMKMMTELNDEPL